MPGMDPRMMKQAMKRMGIKQDEIEATQVVIRTPAKDLVIDEPQVVKINMMGQDSFQISGQVKEVARSTSVEVSQDDINTVIEQTGCTEDEAKDAIKEADGDLAEAILKFKKDSE